jgi:signal peptidase I
MREETGTGMKKVWNAVSTLLVVVVVALAVLLVGVRVVGLTPYAVLSGSMEPTYHVGSLIYVKSIEPQDVEVGMPLTFVVDENLTVATHRVVDIFSTSTKEETVLDDSGNPVLDENGAEVTQEVPLEETAYYFQTKGDANENADGALVYYKNVIGTPVFTVPYLGYLSSWLQTKKGTIIGITIAIVIVILSFLPDLLKAVDDKPKVKHAAKSDDQQDHQ